MSPTPSSIDRGRDAGSPGSDPTASATSRWLAMQGFSCSGGPPPEHRWLRFTPVLSGIWILVGVALGSAWILWAFALVSAVGAASRRHPFDHLHERVVRPVLDAPALPPNPPPRRFAMAVAAGWAAITGILFALGLTATGILVGTVLIVAAATVASSHFCLGSWMYRRLGAPFG